MTLNWNEVSKMLMLFVTSFVIQIGALGTKQLTWQLVSAAAIATAKGIITQLWPGTNVISKKVPTPPPPSHG